MTALSESYRDEAKKMTNRGSVWVNTFSDKWAHIYDTKLVKMTSDSMIIQAEVLEAKAEGGES